jgi:hypothetical protein
MNRRAAFTVLLALSASAAGAQPTTATDFGQLMALFRARQRSHVTFTETHEMAMLKQPLTSSGELRYEAPARLEKRTLTPRPETLILDGDVLTARRGKHEHQLELAAYPQAVPFVESMRATLAGDAAALERYFNVQFSGGLTDWKLRLTPRDAALAQSVAEVTLSGEQAAIHTVEIRERDGDRSLISVGPEIPP